MRSENGYKLVTKKNSTEVILKAVKYRELDQNFIFESKKYNFSMVQEGYNEFNNLTKKIILSSLGLSFVMTFISTVVFTSDISVSYFLGSIFGILYFFLLSIKTESIGSSEIIFINILFNRIIFIN